MSETFQERRRTWRGAASGLGRCELTSSSTVRLLDVSPGGAQLSGRCPVTVSQRAELLTAFEGQPFRSTVDVRWVCPEGQEADAGAVRLGVRFVDVDEGSRRVLGQLLRKVVD